LLTGTIILNQRHKERNCLNVILKRKKLFKRYFEYERLMHRWIQITLTDKLKLEEEEGIELAHGYHYVGPELQVRMVAPSITLNLGL
jgi:hypothetical protein